MVRTAATRKKKMPKSQEAWEKVCSKLRPRFRASRPNHEKITSGAKIPTHSYHSHCSRKKYERVCNTCRYASVIGGKNGISAAAPVNCRLEMRRPINHTNAA